MGLMAKEIREGLGTRLGQQPSWRTAMASQLEQNNQVKVEILLRFSVHFNIISFENIDIS